MENEKNLLESVPKRIEDISSIQWILWLLATATSAVILVSYIYTNFVTKADAESLDKRMLLLQDTLNHRLDRMEDKIDRVLEYQKTNTK